jgi:plasmid stability protein
MTFVPTLHVRNVPKDLYDGLAALARRNGRSLNAEVIAVLRDAFAREERADGFMQRLEELRGEFLLPDDAPSPEDVIRDAREERTHEVGRRARRL